MTLEVFAINSRKVVPSLSLVKFVALGAHWRVANEASVNVVANVRSAYCSTQKTLIDVDASFTVATKFVAFGTDAQESSMQVLAVVRTNWLALCTLVDVNAGVCGNVEGEARIACDFRSEGKISGFTWNGIFDRFDLSDDDAGHDQWIHSVVHDPIAGQHVFVEFEPVFAGLPRNAVKTPASVDANLRFEAAVVLDLTFIDVFANIQAFVEEQSWPAILQSLRPLQAFKLAASTAARNRRMKAVSFVIKPASYAASVVIRGRFLTNGIAMF